MISTILYHEMSHSVQTSVISSGTKRCVKFRILLIKTFLSLKSDEVFDLFPVFLARS